MPLYLQSMHKSFLIFSPDWIILSQIQSKATMLCKHQLAKVFIMLSMSKFLCYSLTIWLAISVGNGLVYFQHIPSYPRHVGPFYQPPEVQTYSIYRSFSIILYSFLQRGLPMEDFLLKLRHVWRVNNADEFMGLFLIKPLPRCVGFTINTKQGCVPIRIL